ncbi:hypothetical protein D1007_12426 [Hordeum vulgare]|nr:hypothetical protein D1007_12426 [Hordeum vulgare]
METHMRKMDLTVVYTNNPVMVEDSIDTMERLLAEDDKFVNSPDYGFAMVDTTNDRKVLKTSGLACEKLVDIRDHYKISGSKKDMDSHVDLDEAIIDPYYKDMKTEGKKNKLVWHSA